MYNIAVIGGGVVGGMIARAMSKYEGSIVLLEKEEDVAMGQSKANSGIVHAGYDPEPGSLKAILNVRGSQMMEKVCRELDVRYRRNGTLVVGFDRKDMEILEALLERGRKNGVEGLEIIDGEAVRRMEKNLSKKIAGALYAPTGAVVCPYELTLHAIGNAMDNGAELLTGFEVTGIERREDGGPAASKDKASYYRLTSADGRSIEARYVVNCAGIHSDEIAAMAGACNFSITPRRGQYLLLDKEAGDMVGMTVFRTPGKMGKGVLATKTVDGNILLGPTSEDIEDKEDKAVTAAGLAAVTARETEFFDSLPMNQVITQFTGLRAHGSTGDFIIESPERGFINCAGIESPGLSASPAIAEMVERMLLEAGAAGELKRDYEPEVRSVIRFKDMSFEEKNRLIAQNPSYGKMICRCEEITEGEIIDAIRRNPPARDIDGVKRRTRAGMGRCQGGFCMPAVAEILSKELGIPFEQVAKSGEGSEIVFGRTKTGKPEKSGRTFHADVAVIGGGPAGMSAAIAAREAGAPEVIIIERESRLGGILKQCIHNGFGLHGFREELTGPEYGERYEKMVADHGITVMTDTMAVDISEDRVIKSVNKELGFFTIEAGALVLAMGCRERPRGALKIAGTRPAGVITAGTAQKLVNIEGYMPGKRIVILGSGDIGLIMARRMTLEGAEVAAVCEIMEDLGGLTRNIVQCLRDFDIPLLLRHTVVEIHGRKRVEGVTVARVDENLKPVAGTEKYIECDTLMLSVGLIPENELSKKAGIELDAGTKGPVTDQNRQTGISGIFACGNVVKVHELVDFVSDEGEIAGRAAALYAMGKLDCEDEGGAGLNGVRKKAEFLKGLEQKKGVRHLSGVDEKESVVICTICPMGCKMTVDGDMKVTGNTCKRGEGYAIREITAPERTLTTTMPAEDGTMVPVKTDRPVPREKLSACMKVINSKTLILPIEAGDIIIENIEKTGANVIATRSFS